MTPNTLLKRAEAELLRETEYALDTSRPLHTTARRAAADLATIITALRGME